MPFTSVTFLAFFVMMLVIYYMIPGGFRWKWLLFGSCVFYLWSVPYFSLFLLFSAFTTWIFPLHIGKMNETLSLLPKEERRAHRPAAERKKKFLIAACLACNIGLLAFLKYAAIVLDAIHVSKSDWLILPLGISFYTFQSVGYGIDVYREITQPQKNFFKHLLYVVFFPQVCQGPIGRYNKLAPQLFAVHSFDYDRFIRGLTRMLLGFFKKMAVADNIGVYVNAVYGNPQAHAGLTLGIATVYYAFQLYADFSGYMDIAIGAGECLGIRLDENFRTPYFSRSISEFWRRWHITLGSWFKDYLYYPILRSAWCTGLGKRLSKSGHKKMSKMLPTVIGLGFTWGLIGMWHGSSINFFLHGLYHGFFIILAVVLADVYGKMKSALHIRDENRFWRFFQTVRTFVIVCLGYVLFRAETLADAGVIVSKLFGPFSFADLKSTLLVDGVENYHMVTIPLSLIICLVLELIEDKWGFIEWLNGKRTAVRWGVLYALLLCVWTLTEWGAKNAGRFLYFNF